MENDSFARNPGKQNPANQVRSLFQSAQSIGITAPPVKVTGRASRAAQRMSKGR